MKIAILLESQYEVLEVWYPLLRLREAGHETFTVAPEKGKTYESKHGYPCTSNFSIDEISADSLDGLVIPGGWCPDLLRRDKRIVNLVRTMMESGKVVAAVCRGPWLLCSAKCIKGRQLAGLIAIKDDIENAGAIYQDKSVVVDGNLITSRLPTDLHDLCKAIVEKLV